MPIDHNLDIIGGASAPLNPPPPEGRGNPLASTPSAEGGGTLALVGTQLAAPVARAGTTPTQLPETLLAQRRRTHGSFAVGSRISQEIKRLIRGGRAAGALPLTRVQQEALDMIALKIGRIIAGDPNHRDHWQDIAGYAQLIADRL